MDMKQKVEKPQRIQLYSRGCLISHRLGVFQAVFESSNLSIHQTVLLIDSIKFS